MSDTIRHPVIIQSYHEIQRNSQICRDFLRGQCQRKNCKFLHTYYDGMDHGYPYQMNPMYPVDMYPQQGYMVPYGRCDDYALLSRW